MSELIDRRFGGLPDLFRLRNVAHHRDGIDIVAGDGVRCRLGKWGCEVQAGDVAPVSGETTADRHADPAGRACHQGALAAQIEQVGRLVG